MTTAGSTVALRRPLRPRERRRLLLQAVGAGLATAAATYYVLARLRQRVRLSF
jgi:hypothetical protein